MKPLDEDEGKRSEGRRGDGEPPLKMTKLAVEPETRPEDRYKESYDLVCWTCDPKHGFINHVPQESPQDAAASKFKDVITNSLGSLRREEVKAWEEEIEACEHTLTIQQSPPSDAGQIKLDGGCSRCDLKENLWLCLVCGSIGCGRSQFGGLKGNSHGLSHFEETGHGASVKLGTITPEGGGDVFCYTCADTRLDFELPAHLATFGISVLSQQKTEKSMTELQIEQNLTYDFSVTSHDGTLMQPLFGKGLTGFANLGNSCYINSVVQTLFALPSFQQRYSNPDHTRTCSNPLPATCLECQMLKLSNGLLSGDYSHPSELQTKRALQAQNTSEPPVVFQDGLKPMNFKSLVGKGHPEFATMKQQDAEEFLSYLLTVLRRENHKTKSVSDPTKVFTFAMQQRLQCLSCKGVKYRVDTMDVLGITVPAKEKGKTDEGKVLYEDVNFKSCLQDATNTSERVEGWKCTSCSSSEGAIRQATLASLPEVLVVHAKKFQLLNWVPTKLDIPLILPSHTLTFDNPLSTGLQPSETLLPDSPDEASSSSNDPTANLDPEALSQLQAMGFPLVRCQKALIAVGGAGGTTEAAMEWLFAHMEDPDIDDPIPAPASGGGPGSAVQPNEDQILSLMDMGFTMPQASKALRETSNNPERAVEWLFNHTDDPGDVEQPASSIPSDPSPNTAGEDLEIPGSKAIPASYRLKAFISHKGPSVHSGHYVAHIRNPGVHQGGDEMQMQGIQGTSTVKEDEWALFNDEKVVKADKESVEDLVRLAYLYVFEKV
jgi:ubiquitin carboxyl-terminal hydrolase 5/13